MSYGHEYLRELAHGYLSEIANWHDNDPRYFQKFEVIKQYIAALEGEQVEDPARPVEIAVTTDPFTEQFFANFTNDNPIPLADAGSKLVKQMATMETPAVEHPIVPDDMQNTEVPEPKPSADQLEELKKMAVKLQKESAKPAPKAQSPQKPADTSGIVRRKQNLKSAQYNKANKK